MLSACTRDEISNDFNAQSSVYFYYSTGPYSTYNIDSISYSFVEKSSAVQQDTIWLPVRINGAPSGMDRSINLAAENSSTAIKDVHYKLLDYHMPKDAFQTSLGVVLLRDASLRDTSVVLNLALQTSNDFPVLMKDTLMGDGQYYSKNKVRIIFTDRLIKPGNWDSYLVTFFGIYSNTKFRFMAEVLGVSSFPNTGPDALKYPTLQFYQNTVRNALVEYNALNGPLIDENGNPVVFP